MVSYNTYPPLPSAPPDAPPQVAYHLNVVQDNRPGLKAKEQMFKKKYEIELTDVVKCLFKWNKHSHWNI